MHRLDWFSAGTYGTQLPNGLEMILNRLLPARVTGPVGLKVSLCSSRWLACDEPIALVQLLW